MSGDVADAVVIGSGPNGLVAAITLARKGWDVTVVEREPVAGGAVRSEPLTQPGFVHDTFSAFYGVLHASPVFARLELADRIRWARFESSMSVAVDPHRAAFIRSTPGETAAGLGIDAGAWQDTWRWWTEVGRAFFDMTVAPLPSLRPSLRFGRRTGIRGALPTAATLLAPAADVASQWLKTEEARALLVCGITHSDLSVEAIGSLPPSLLLAMLAQEHNMPVPVGGAGELSRTLVEVLDDARGRVLTGDAVVRVDVERGRAVAVRTQSGAILRARHAVLADTGPGALIRDLVGEEEFPSSYLDGLRRFRYGTGVFKMDLALSGPVPWLVEGHRRSGVVHLTGTLDDMARANFEARHGSLPQEPALIVGQQSLADPTRAPEGAHTLWIETHVPPVPARDGERAVQGWDDGREIFAERVLDRIEAHAPGFRGLVVGSAVHTPMELQARNPNLVGGDIGGGSMTFDQQLVFRPVPGWFRYRTPVRGLYLCSASTHPGGGVHGMCGLNAARRVLRDALRPGAILRTATAPRRRPAPAP